MKMKVRIVTIILLILSIPLISFASTLFPALINGQYGYCDSNKSVVIVPQWDDASFFRAGKVALVGKNNDNGVMLQGIINTQGDEVVPCKYYISEGEEYLWGGEDGYYSVQDPVTGLYGYYDIRNDFFCQPQYFDVNLSTRDQFGLLPVIDAMDYQCGLICDRDGSSVAACLYVECYPADGGLSVAVSDDAYWIVHADGSVFPISYCYTPDNMFSNNLIIAHHDEDDYFCLLNEQGNQMTFEHYSQIEYNQDMHRFYGKLNGREKTVYVEIFPTE